MQTKGCFWKFGIDRVSKIGSEQKWGGKKKKQTLKQNKVREATNMPLSPTI